MKCLYHYVCWLPIADQRLRIKYWTGSFIAYWLVNDWFFLLLDCFHFTTFTAKGGKAVSLFHDFMQLQIDLCLLRWGEPMGRFLGDQPSNRQVMVVVSCNRHHLVAVFRPQRWTFNYRRGYTSTTGMRIRYWLLLTFMSWCSLVSHQEWFLQGPFMGENLPLPALQLSQKCLSG